LAMTALQIRKVIPMNNDENFNARLALKWGRTYLCFLQLTAFIARRF
jgi:hypothetical protein